MSLAVDSLLADPRRLALVLGAAAPAIPLGLCEDGCGQPHGMGALGRPRRFHPDCAAERKKTSRRLWAARSRRAAA